MTDQRIIWLTSFPKSGNTWIRILLAHYFLPKEQAIDINSIDRFTTSDMRKDFFDKANGRPIEKLSEGEWMALRPKVLTLISRSRTGHHFTKTHSCMGFVNGAPLIPPHVTAGAIYILRNPFDVSLSYARHLGIDVDTAIDRMTNPQNSNGSALGVREVIGRWDTHIQGWTQADGLRLVVLRYEDLVRDTFRSVQPIFQYLGVKPETGKLRRAIRKSSFKELQKQESEKGFRERPATSEQFFVSGTSGQWRDKLSEAQIDRIRQEFAPTLSRYYTDMMREFDGKTG